MLTKVISITSMLIKYFVPYKLKNWSKQLENVISNSLHLPQLRQYSYVYYKCSQ